MRAVIAILGIMSVIWFMVTVVSSLGDGRRIAVQPASSKHPLPELWSGFRFQSQATRAVELTSTETPGQEWIDRGRQLWDRKLGPKRLACASCHNRAEVSMAGAAVRYPIISKANGKLTSLEQRINICRTSFVGMPEWLHETDELLAMTTYVRSRSRGVPINVAVDGPARTAFEAGRALYELPLGQLGLSCADCHDRSWSKRYRARTLSQGQSNGFPVYRLAAKRPGSLHGQFITCNRRVRAEPFPSGSDDYLNLELYVAWRGVGLRVEAPGVRP